MEAGIVLRFSAALERFVSPYARLSNAVMRMARIARIEALVSLRSGVAIRTGGYPVLRRDTPAA